MTATTNLPLDLAVPMPAGAMPYNPAERDDAAWEANAPKVGECPE